MLGVIRKTIIFFSVFIVALYLMLVNQFGNISGTSCDGFQCWLEKKEKLNENIGRVCRKYRDSLLLPGDDVDRLKNFLLFDKIANCINTKVLSYSHYTLEVDIKFSVRPLQLPG